MSCQLRYGNRTIQKKENSENLERHYQSLRKVRPMTGFDRDRSITINKKKKQMNMQNRFTEIERQNRLLLQKITSIMSKGSGNGNGAISQTIQPRETSYGFQYRPSTTISSQLNKNSLNSQFRKKQMASIEYENAKMLKRLKEKKSSYAIGNLNKDWKRNKTIIQKMSMYPFILNDNPNSTQIPYNKNEAFPQQHSFTVIQNPRSQTINRKDYELKRIIKINGFEFLITLKFEAGKLYIIGEQKEEQEIKVIQLGARQANQFVSRECGGRVEEIFGLLKYDSESGELYLVTNEEQSDEGEAHQKVMERAPRAISHQGARKRNPQSAGLRRKEFKNPPRPQSKDFITTTIKPRVNDFPGQCEDIPKPQIDNKAQVSSLDQLPNVNEPPSKPLDFKMQRGIREHRKLRNSKGLTENHVQQIENGEEIDNEVQQLESGQKESLWVKKKTEPHQEEIQDEDQGELDQQQKSGIKQQEDSERLMFVQLPPEQPQVQPTLN